MIELLTESLFRIEQNQDNKTVIVIHKSCEDGLAHVGSIHQKIILSDYGFDALEKNLKRLLLEILKYKEEQNFIGMLDGRTDVPKLWQKADVG